MWSVKKTGCRCLSGSMSIPILIALVGCQAQPDVPKRDGDHVVTPAGNVADYAISGEPVEGGEPGEWEFFVAENGKPLQENRAFLWDFGDSQAYAGPRQRHVFSSTGPAVVSASALATDGSVSFTVSDVFEIIIELSITLNEPPIADAGRDIVVTSGATVTLDGSGSYDPEEDVLAYTWTQISGEDVEFLTPTDEPTLTFVAPIVDRNEVLTFRLSVSDGKLIAKDSVVVDVDALIDSASFECPVKFFVALSDPSPDNPFEGAVPVTAECTFVSVDGSDPPEGIYTWRFDDDEDSGSVRTHARRMRVFDSVGLHRIALTFTMVGASVPVNCVNAHDGGTVIRVNAYDPVDPGVPDPPPDDPTLPPEPPLVECLTDADCDDGIDCTIGSCDLTTSTCEFAPDDSVCDNGLWCDGEEVCDVAEGCRPGTPPDCDDDVDCTVDSCNEATDSCKHAPSDDLCDNGLWCDGEETCHATLDCRPGVSPCAGTGGTCDEQLDACVAGHTVSGRLTLVPTVGYRPKLGQHDLFFDGSGTWSASDFTATTDVDGNYTQVVPVGWTGTVTASDPSRVLLRLPGKTWADGADWTFGSGAGADAPAVTADKTLNFDVWTAPIGIPGPEFGIRESHYMYRGKTFNFGSGAVPYPEAGNGPYTHYVDNTHPQATDSGNTYGTPSLPRLTFPYNVPAGSVIEIHGGPYYNENPANPSLMIGDGTADKPIFYRGFSESPAQRPVFGHADGNRSVRIDGEYLVIENIDFDGAYVRWWKTTHHISIRNCEVQNTDGYTGVAGAHLTADNRGHDIVIYNNKIHHCGNYLADFDEDAHAIAPMTAWNCFMLDNDLAYCSGDGVQVHNSGISGGTVWTHHNYIGRNLSHHHKQSGLWVKKGSDMILSQNRCYSLRPMGDHPSAPGSGFGCQYEQTRIWWLFNEVHDADQGIRFGDTALVEVAGETPSNELYVIGNFFHDITHSDIESYGEWSDVEGSARGYAILSRRGQFVTIAGNTVLNCEGGIGVDRLEMPDRFMDIRNNLVANSEAMFSLSIITAEDTAARSRAINNLFYSSSGPVDIRWHEFSERYTVSAWKAAYPAASTGSIEADPKFVSAAALDVRLRAGSPAADSGDSLSDIFERFEELYGLDIAVDFDGRRRPQGSALDIGAFERPN